MSSFTLDAESKEDDTFYKLSVPSSTNQDRSKYWILNGGETRIFLVADGHGSKGEKFAEACISVMNNFIETIDWTKDVLDDEFNTIFKEIDSFCKVNLNSILGGSTLSICLMRKDKDIYVANVGDSDVIMFDNKNKTYNIMSADHSPTSIEEYKRISQEFSNTRFTYHPVNRFKQKVNIFKQNDDGEYIFAEKPVGNVFYKNVRQELATIICNVTEPSSYITISRSIGDFKYKEKNGLISTPSISKYPVLEEGQFIICASDGFWDCWKYEEIFVEFIEDKETWEKKHKDNSIKLFGTKFDDMSAFFIY